MTRPPVTDDLELSGGWAGLALPVMLGLIAGIIGGLVTMLTLGRLTLDVLYARGTTGILVNAVLGVAAAVAIGFAATRLTVARARVRDVGHDQAVRAGLLAGTGSVLMVMGLGMTTPLHPVTWFAELVLGGAASWWASRTAAPSR
jgi:hypothetical protein